MDRRLESISEWVRKRGMYKKFEDSKAYEWIANSGPYQRLERAVERREQAAEHGEPTTEHGERATEHEERAVDRVKKHFRRRLDQLNENAKVQLIKKPFNPFLKRPRASSAIAVAGLAAWGFMTECGGTVNMHLSPSARTRHQVFANGIRTNIELREGFSPPYREGEKVGLDDLSVAGISSTLEKGGAVKLRSRIYGDDHCVLDDDHLPLSAFDYLNPNQKSVEMARYVAMTGFEGPNDPRYHPTPQETIEWHADKELNLITRPHYFVDRQHESPEGQLDFLTVTSWGCPVLSYELTSYALIYVDWDYEFELPQNLGRGLAKELEGLNEMIGMDFRVYPFLVSENLAMPRGYQGEDGKIRYHYEEGVEGDENGCVDERYWRWNHGRPLNEFVVSLKARNPDLR